MSNCFRIWFNITSHSNTTNTFHQYSPFHTLLILMICFLLNEYERNILVCVNRCSTVTFEKHCNCCYQALWFVACTQICTSHHGVPSDQRRLVQTSIFQGVQTNEVLCLLSLIVGILVWHHQYMCAWTRSLLPWSFERRWSEYVWNSEGDVHCWMWLEEDRWVLTPSRYPDVSISTVRSR